jgi:hypothetical protein
MRALLFALLLLMIYECIGCHQKYDKKGSLSRHQAHCTRFKQEAQKRRTKYSLAAEIIHVDNTPIAEGSKGAGIEDVMGFTQDDEVGPGALDGPDVEMVDPVVRFTRNYSFSSLTILE